MPARQKYLEQTEECQRCGDNHAKTSVCQAMGKTCGYRGRPNHFARMCTSRKKKNQKKKGFSVHSVADKNEDREEAYAMDTVCKATNDERHKATIVVNKAAVITFHVDTGAT